MVQRLWESDVRVEDEDCRPVPKAWGDPFEGGVVGIDPWACLFLYSLLISAGTVAMTSSLPVPDTDACVH